MALSPGTRLGPYEIVAPIGAGGMGEVYRARDTKLDRDVAIKVLPESFALDADRVARFTREAKTLASLNHPNIAAIYGIEESPATGSGQAGSMRALVMELVEGDDLSVLIARSAGPKGPALHTSNTQTSGAPDLQVRRIELNDALAIAKQIADALEAAHEQGIVHRDLKPANVKVRTDGTVKVLDFGLAKALDASASGATAGEAMNSPTMTARMTQMGMILGTAAYMAPEQAKGKVVDRRADIWAFGVVLHEMLTGRRLFDAEDVSETLAAVLTRDVTATPLPPEIPARLRTLVRDCLIRDPKQRLRDIGDARLVLDKLIAGAPDDLVAPVAASVAAAAPSRSRERFAWAALVVAAALLAPLSLKWFAGSRPEPVTGRFDIALPAKTNPLGWPDISPDGRAITVVVAGDDGVHRLWIRPIDATEFHVLAGTEGASYPFWSPGSDSIGFFAGETLKRISVTGGPPVPVCPAFRGRGGTWSQAGVIVFSTKTKLDAPEQLWQVADNGSGAPTVLAPLATRSFALQRFPHFLPDGRHYLYFASERKAETDGVYVAALGETGAKRIVPGFTEARYSDGTLFFVRDTTLLAQSFDASSLRLGPADPIVLLPVSTAANEGGQAFSVSEAGVLIAVPRVEAADFQLKWFDRHGQAGGNVGLPSPRVEPRISPDGKRVVTSLGLPGTIATGGSLGLTDVANGRYQRLTFTDGGFSFPVWSQDSSAILFGMAAIGNGISDLFRQPANSGAAIEPLLADRAQKLPTDVSPDGRFLVYISLASQSQLDLKLLSLADRKSSLVAKNVTRARVSPDGRWIAYAGTESSKSEIYIQSFPSAGAKIQVTDGGGNDPVWSRNGRELFYIAGSKLMALPISTSGSSAVPGEAAALFDLPGAPHYDVAVDGRFLFNVPVANQVPRAVVTMNWKSGLKK